VPSLGRKVRLPTLDVTRIPVSRSNCQRSGLEVGGGHTMSVEPDSHTACFLFTKLIFAEFLYRLLREKKCYYAETYCDNSRKILVVCVL